MSSMTVHRTFPISVQPGIPRLGDPKRGWTRYQIGQLFEEVKRPANIQDNERYRLVTVRRARGGLAPRSKLLGKEISVKSQFIIRAGDFLISKRQIVHGACAVVTDEFDGAIVSNEYSVLRCKKNLKLEYLEQLFHSVYVQQTFFHSSLGVHIEKMIFKLDDWFKWPINLPTLPEQQKIAAFLYSVDRKIAKLGQKKALLQRYKNGMMQKLFSQELRFKDTQGHDFPDWEVKRLGEVLTIGSGRDYKHLGNGDIPVYGTGGYMTSVDEYLHDGESVCIGRKGTIDKPVYLAGKFWTVDTLFFTHSFNSAVPKFIYAVFQSINWKKHNEASGVPSLSKTTIEKIKISIPSVSEQQKIADFLSSIDRKIDLIATELDHAKAFKKGLLQQMFI